MPGCGAYAAYVDPTLGPGRDAVNALYYGRRVYEKLRRIKRRLDPLDVFHNPQSVERAPPPGPGLGLGGTTWEESAEQTEEEREQVEEQREAGAAEGAGEGAGDGAPS
ncbi:hypothetical protein GGR56DRAFT_643841 [Xylariaceae sp. FL0804]|nr:hypothetical protein GGR56DRAFT_662311 [Xylariaceae sp. FL0804]KAI0474950.1 hypothetical protein GGR56DRAFT_643841 [Xylariaceae sp. FL0804]